MRARVASVATLRKSGVGDIVASVARELHELMDAPTFVARPVRHEQGHVLDFAEGRGFEAGAIRNWADVIRRTPRGAFLFDPARPARAQRNVLHELALDDPRAAQGAMGALRAMGIGSSTQLRVLVCDGPLLLSWVGSYLPRDRAVTHRDRVRLRRFALGVRPMLRLVAGVRGNLAADALDALMEAYPGEVYLVHADGRIACANDLGSRILDERGEDAQREIGRALRSADDGPYQVHPVRRLGMRAMALVTRAPRTDAILEARLARAHVRWRLSPREREVLRALAQGHANKDIATLHDTSLRTVEVHVTSLLRKSRAESRLDLVVQVWKGE